MAPPAPPVTTPPLPARQVVKRAVRLPTAHRFRLAWRLGRSPRVPLRARLPLLALLIYLAMPLDIVPDFLPVIGQLDDVLIAGLAVWWFVRVCPPLVAIDEIEQLEQTPLTAFDRRIPALLVGLASVLAGLALLWLVQRLR